MPAKLWPELQAWIPARIHARPLPRRVVYRPGLQARIRSAPDRRRYTTQVLVSLLAILLARLLASLAAAPRRQNQRMAT